MNMKYQIIEFDLDKELSKDAVDNIFSILKKEGAENIELNFTNVKHKNYEKSINNQIRMTKEEQEVYG